MSMKIPMSLLLLAGVMFPDSSHSGEQAILPPPPEVVAGCFGYSGHLEYKDDQRPMTDHHHVGKVLWIRIFESTNDTFAATSVVLYEGNTHLGGDNLSRMKESHAKSIGIMRELHETTTTSEIEKLEADTFMNHDLDRPLLNLTTSDGRKGYSRAFYMHGTGIAIASVPSRDGRFDLKVMTVVPLKREPLKATPETAEYAERMKNDPEGELCKYLLKLEAVLFGE